ncbi:hypothetical protein Bbelb_299120 [Branchiostoma belcheri]|nr:hypothetical protein Bbelb_299120 [Branchiostoma belcheri]
MRLSRELVLLAWGRTGSCLVLFLIRNDGCFLADESIASISRTATTVSTGQRAHVSANPLGWGGPTATCTIVAHPGMINISDSGSLPRRICMGGPGNALSEILPPECSITTCVLSGGRKAVLSAN